MDFTKFSIIITRKIFIAFVFGGETTPRVLCTTELARGLAGELEGIEIVRFPVVFTGERQKNGSNANAYDETDDPHESQLNTQF